MSATNRKMPVDPFAKKISEDGYALHLIYRLLLKFSNVTVTDFRIHSDSTKSKSVRKNPFDMSSEPILRPAAQGRPGISEGNFCIFFPIYLA
jgi:hypothetical protein